MRTTTALLQFLAVIGSGLLATLSGHAAPVVKSATAGTTDLTLGAAWTGGTAPGSGDVATWNSTSLGGTLLFNTVTWQGIDIQTPAAGRVVTLTGKTAGQTLSIGASGINVATLNTLAFTATGGIAPAIGVLGDQTWTLGGVGSTTGRILFGTGSTLTVDAAVSTGGWKIVLNNTATTVGAAALEFNATNGTAFDLSKAEISGAGTIHIRANNKVTLGGNNSFTGTIENRTGGDVDFSVLASAGTNSSFGAGTGNLFNISSNSGTVLTNTGAGGSTNRSLNVLSQSAGGLSLLNNGTGSVSFLGSGTIGTTVTVTGGLILGGTYTGAANVMGQVYEGAANSLTKQDASIWELTGANTYAGDTTITGGTLRVNSMADYGTSSALGQGTAGTPVVIGSASASAVLEYIGGAATSNRTIRIGSTVAGASGSATINNNGSGALVFTETGFFNAQNVNTDSGRTLTLGGAHTGANEIKGIIRNMSAIGGTIGVAKADAGTWILSGANTYTGTTVVSGGLLVVNGNQSTATGAVTVSNAGTKLAGVGTIGGATSIGTGAILSAGNHATTPVGAIGSLSTGGNLSFDSGSIFSWDINTAANTSDTVSVGGTLGITGGAIFKVVSTTAFSDTFWDTGRSWNVFGGKDFTGFGLQYLANGTSQVAGDFASEGYFSINGVTHTLDWTPVPEPTSALAGILLGAGLLRRRRGPALRV